MLVGDVPESYISVPNDNNDYMNFVPTRDPFEKQMKHIDKYRAQ